MPGLNGVETLASAQSRRSTRPIPASMVTTKSEDGIQDEPRPWGSTRFVTTPIHQ